MRFSVKTFEAAAKKRRASGESSQPAKRPRESTIPPPAKEPAERKPMVKAVPEPAGADIEEGEIQATTAPVVVDLDEEEVEAAAPEVPAAEPAAATGVPPANDEPATEIAPPTRGGQTSRGSQAGAKVTEKEKGSERRSSSRRSAHHPTRPRVEGPLEGEGNTRRVPRPESMSDAVEASRILAEAQTARSREEMRGMSHSAILDMVMVAVVQMANGAIGLREALAESSGTLSKALARAEKHKKESAEQAQSLARLHHESRAREESLSGRLKEAESRASAAEARLELALRETQTAEARIEELVRQLQRAEAENGEVRDEIRAAKEKAEAAERAAAEAGTEKAGAVACADEACARAEEAAERAREAEARAREAEAQAQEARARTQEAEAETLRVKAEAERAVVNYKASAEFEQEVVEASLDAYIQGFEVCKTRVCAALQIDSSKLEGIQPGGSEDEEPEETETKPASGSGKP